jgi:hypothetical protein
MEDMAHTGSFRVVGMPITIAQWALPAEKYVLEQSQEKLIVLFVVAAAPQPQTTGQPF